MHLSDTTAVYTALAGALGALNYSKYPQRSWEQLRFGSGRSVHDDSTHTVCPGQYQ